MYKAFNTFEAIKIASETFLSKFAWNAAAKISLVNGINESVRKEEKEKAWNDNKKVASFCFKKILCNKIKIVFAQDFLFASFQPTTEGGERKRQMLFFLFRLVTR